LEIAISWKNTTDNTTYYVPAVGVGDVFITAGQSNAANCGSKLQKTSTMLVSSFNGDNWQIANDPQPIATWDKGSIWPILGDMLVETLNSPIGFLNLGVGGSFIHQWSPKRQGVLYETRFKKFVPLIKDYGFKAVLWHQGESEALYYIKSSSRSCYDGMKDIITSFKKDFGNKPWVIAIVGNMGDGDIRIAQKKIIKDGLALKGPDTDILDVTFRENYDSSHFNEKGLVAHARLWYASLIWHFYNDLKPFPRRPVYRIILIHHKKEISVGEKVICWGLGQTIEGRSSDIVPTWECGEEGELSENVGERVVVTGVKKGKCFIKAKYENVESETFITIK